MTSAQDFRQAFPPMVICMWGPGEAAARHVAHPLQRPGHTRGRGGGSKGGCCGLRCCGPRGCPSPLSALSWSLSGQAHAKNAHRWIPLERDHCPGGEPPERGPQTSPRHTFLILRCTEEGQGWGGGDGWRHLRGPDALPPGVCVVGLGRESSGVAYGAPASTPGAQTRKRKEGEKEDYCWY